MKQPRPFFQNCAGGPALSTAKQPGMHLQKIAVRHAGNIVADRAVEPLAFYPFRAVGSHQLRFFEAGIEDVPQQRTGLLVHVGHLRMVIQVLVKKPAQFAVGLPQFRAVTDQRLFLQTNLLGGFDPRFFNRRRAGLDHILHLAVDDAPDDIGCKIVTLQFWKMPAHFAVGMPPDFEPGDLLGIDEIEVQAVVKVVAVLGDLIGEIRDLRFQRRT